VEQKHEEPRWKLRFQSFQQSLIDFKQALQQPEYSVLERAGLIQLFEVSFELSWKVLKDYLEFLGHQAKSPRETIRTAFEFGIIEDVDAWLDALETRNTFTHTYGGDMITVSEQKIKKESAPLLLTLEKYLIAVQDDT
jgi:nucleotidyltransferase substrate binding protein (TIGR01987 family)